METFEGIKRRSTRAFVAAGREDHLFWLEAGKPTPVARR
jgi:hypothetical protein